MGKSLFSVLTNFTRNAVSALTAAITSRYVSLVKEAMVFSFVKGDEEGGRNPAHSEEGSAKPIGVLAGDIPVVCKRNRRKGVWRFV